MLSYASSPEDKFECKFQPTFFAWILLALTKVQKNPPDD